MAVNAFDLSERLQTPIFVLSDLDIGMNDWMCKELKWNDKYRPDRGKVLNDAELAKIKDFHRYLDVDGDGIPYRTLPGSKPKGAYFFRGAGHNKYGGRTEVGDEYQDVMDRLLVKWETAKNLVPPPVVRRSKKETRTAILSIGSCDGAIREAIDGLNAQGISVNYMRVRAFPFSEKVEAFLENHDRIFVIEQNRDAQLKSLLINETRVEKKQLVSILNYDGMPMSPDIIEKTISETVAKENAA